MKIDLYDFITAKKATTLEVSPSIWQAKYSSQLINQVIRVYLSNSHQGTKLAKSRGDISQPDRKPWAQKGTGRARHGSRNSPIWVGGGVAFGPQLKGRMLKVNSKMKKRALASVLSECLSKGDLIVIDLPTTKDSKVKTKQCKEFLSKLKLMFDKVGLIFTISDRKLTKAFSNLELVTPREVQLVNTLDIARLDKVIITKNALLSLEQRLKFNNVNND